MIRISVLTVTLNSAGVLPRLIESLRAQITSGIEWIVVDGGSRDGTCTLLAEAGDVVTHWISEPDFGIYHALNKALILARGEYYVVMGDDDVLAAGAIERYLRIAEGSGADIVSAPVWVNGRRIDPRRSSSWLRSGPPRVSAHSVGSLIRRSLHDELGLYSRRLPIAADTLFLLQVERGGKKFAYVDEPAGTFGSDGVSSTDLLGSLSESMRANIRVRGWWPFFFSLFVVRVMRHAFRIGRQR